MLPKEQLSFYILQKGAKNAALEIIYSSSILQEKGLKGQSAVTDWNKGFGL